MPSNGRRPALFAKKALKMAVVLVAVTLLTALIKTVPELAVMFEDQQKALPASLAIVLKVRPPAEKKSSEYSSERSTRRAHSVLPFVNESPTSMMLESASKRTLWAEAETAIAKKTS